MIVNHFPIILTFMGLIILFAGLFFKSKATVNTAYFMFVVAAIFAAVSMATGEGAEDIVKQVSPADKPYIHPHEENAEKLAIVSYISGLLSLIGLWMNYKSNRLARYITYLLIVTSAIGSYFAVVTGMSGGEIRHTEIRSGATLPAGNTTGDIQNHEDHD